PRCVPTTHAERKIKQTAQSVPTPRPVTVRLPVAKLAFASRLTPTKQTAQSVLKSQMSREAAAHLGARPESVWPITSTFRTARCVASVLPGHLVSVRHQAAKAESVWLLIFQSRTVHLVRTPLLVTVRLPVASPASVSKLTLTSQTAQSAL